MKNIWFRFVVVWILALSSTIASDNPRAVIIFDASGSMWGQINGVTKIEIARDALKNVVKEWNSDVELGLTVYGHRSKGDCNDIETVIPVGKIDKNRVVSTVMDIKPKGKTPISRSLKKVADEIKYTEEKATIILISDGKETCDPNPCAVAKELEQNGIDFVVHVIGFDVDKKTAQELGCIAAATGGEYFPAKNATALNNAMKTIAKKVEVVEPKPTPKPIPKPVVKKLKNNIEVSASEKEGGKWVKAYHRIYRAENGQKIDGQLTSVNSTQKDAGKTLLDDGSYMLQSEYNEFKVQTPFEIKAGEVTKLHAVMGQTGTMEISASEEQGGKWVRAYHRIYKVIDGAKEERETAGFSSTKKRVGERQIATGKYIAISEYNEFKVQTPFEIKAGDVTKLQVAMGQTGTIEISASEKEGGKWVKAYYRIYKVIDGVKEDREMKGFSSTKKRVGEAQIATGKYSVKSEYNEFKQNTPFEIKAGEVTKLQVVMGQTGTIEISASEKEGGKWVKAYHRIYKVIDGVKDDRETKGFSSTKKRVGEAQIATGKYIVISEHNRFKKEQSIEIKAGEATKLNVVFGQFLLGAKCSDMQEQVDYEVYASSGQLIYEERAKCSNLVKITLDNGNYTVEAKISSGKKEAKFMVGTEQENKLIVDLTNLNHKEEIEADRQEPLTPLVEPKESSGKITLGDKEIEIKGISKKDAEQIEKLGAVLGALGGVMQGSTQEKKAEQETKNTQADKEFEDMSKNLDMYTK